MIVIKLQGGLGNQMFQYASARSLAHKLGVNLGLDLTWFDNVDQVDTPRHYELDCFNISATLLKSEEYRLIGDGSKKVLGLIGRKLKPKLELSEYIEQHFHYNERFLQLPDNTLLEGYFQSEKYFKRCRDIILRDFEWIEHPSVQNQEILGAIHDGNSVSLHVRRGDYISNKNANKFHGTKGLDYYELAVKEIVKQVKKPVFYVISDDPEWCQENIKIKHPVSYISHNKKGCEDMRLMKSCKHNIIANSSFSWWAAWLNTNPDKIVVAPKQWFNDPSIDTSDVLPAKWIKI